MRPLIISHAACAGHALENTLAGIRAALELGADAVEIDVQATADGVPVLMHDLTVDRTTNGSGDIASLTLEQLQALDAGGEPVPTFAQALELTSGRALLVAEIKRPGCEASVADVVRQADAERDVMVWSFLPTALTAMRQEEPKLPGCLPGRFRPAASRTIVTPWPKALGRPTSLPSAVLTRTLNFTPPWAGADESDSRR